MDGIRDFRSVLNAQDVDELKRRVESAGKSARRSKRTLAGYVNHGRWVTDCLCGSGVACAPDCDECVCLECGTVYGVKFPGAKAVAAATKALVSRPMSKRNWTPEEETPRDLAAENALHGFLTEGES
jgi:hypothetical protein